MDSYEKYILSGDWHLTDGSSTENITSNEDLMEFLFYVRDHRDYTLILMGDILDLWQCDVESIYREHQEILDTLMEIAEEDRLIYLRGNHDEEIDTEIHKIGFDMDPWIYDSYTLDYRGRSIFIHHGNVYDIFNHGKLSWIGKYVTKVAGVFEKLIDSKFEERMWDYIYRIKRHIYPSPENYSGNNYEFLQRAIDDLKEYDCVIYGHTHDAGMYYIDRAIKQIQSEVTRSGESINIVPGSVVNTGAWIFGREDIYVIEDEKITMWDFRDFPH